MSFCLNKPFLFSNNKSTIRTTLSHRLTVFREMILNIQGGTMENGLKKHFKTAHKEKMADFNNIALICYCHF